MSTELQKFTQTQYAAAPVPATVDEAIRLGEIMARSGMFKDGADAAKAVAKVIAGRELGVGPMAAMTGINIIQGRVTLSANLVAGLIKRSGRYDYRATVTDQQAEVVILERGQEIGRAEFTIDDAKRAKLAGDNWTKYPKDMMFARCITAAARRHCPDVFSGPLFFADEGEQAYTDPDTGEVVATIVEPPPDAADRYRQVKAAADEAGIDDLADVWAQSGVEAQRDLLDDAKFAAAMRAVSPPSGDDDLADQLWSEGGAVVVEHGDPS